MKNTEKILLIDLLVTEKNKIISLDNYDHEQVDFIYNLTHKIIEL